MSGWWSCRIYRIYRTLTGLDEEVGSSKEIWRARDARAGGTQSAHGEHRILAILPISWTYPGLGQTVVRF